MFLKGGFSADCRLTDCYHSGCETVSFFILSSPKVGLAIHSNQVGFFDSSQSRLVYVAQKPTHLLINESEKLTQVKIDSTNSS